MGKNRNSLKKRLADWKPKSGGDYCRLGPWLVAKPLAAAGAAAVLLLCGALLLSLWPGREAGKEDGAHIPSYGYRSAALKLQKGNVRILGESGYTAYEGEVRGGEANGTGVLYRRDGSRVYEGEFQENRYEGQGTLYTEDGRLLYEGAFRHNVFDGEGTLYRANGFKEYEGGFSEGKWSGEGTVYGETGKAVFTGTFADGRILYETLLGLETQELCEQYTGEKTVEEAEDSLYLGLDEIGASCVAKPQAESLSDNWTVEGVYVSEKTLKTAGVQAGAGETAAGSSGELLYEGTTVAEAWDAKALAGLTEGTEYYLKAYGRDGFSYSLFYTEKGGRCLGILIER